MVIYYTPSFSSICKQRGAIALYIVKSKEKYHRIWGPIKFYWDPYIIIIFI